MIVCCDPCVLCRSDGVTSDSDVLSTFFLNFKNVYHHQAKSVSSARYSAVLQGLTLILMETNMQL